MKKTVSILGAGWLGHPLALSLKENYKVKVSVRIKEKKEAFEKEGLFPFVLNETSLENLDELLDTNYLFINFPPSKFQDFKGFLEKIYSHKKIETIEKIIFISSTSIYPDEEKTFTEDEVFTNAKSQKIYDIEKLIEGKTDLIFRCAGLMGANRVSGRYFAGKELDSEDVKVNYVHLDDVIRATKFALEKDLKGIYNLCSYEHPTRKEIYFKNASKFGFAKPVFKNKKEYKQRLIDGSKIEKEGFRYKYPNPLEYEY
ncbi:GDP-L-fucose synthase [Arcobacter sp. CECT 8983]|uniref:GDP-L-fucose synthase n=1 Tax=Arcobacter sp. CECT 8983 TaxID=2044508 RepID=UPI00100C06C5|nr:GDP-L-fucose synthase [Arcobacter sp. CECT 8983]RXJ88915.1 GDP-L-fucose synthase [Arcobacter sp. CECT 8983]